MQEFGANKKEMKTDECLTKGICAISEKLSSLGNVMLLYVEELAFYMYRLDKMGAKNEKIQEDFLNAISLITINHNYCEDSYNKLLAKIFEDLYQSKEIYAMICEKNDLKRDYSKSGIKVSKYFNVENITQYALKIFSKREKTFSDGKKKLHTIFLYIIKSICLYIFELRDLTNNIDKYYSEMLEAFGNFNIFKASEENLKEKIEQLVKLDSELLDEVYKSRKDAFGKIIKHNVSKNLKAGKAILASGNNLKELELLLEKTQGIGLDIYTHGQMISAHMYESFTKYENLKGHYGSFIDHYRADFSEFPGAIFLSKLSQLNVNNLYQCKIFTSDEVVSSGINKISDNDFEPIIQAALGAKGFLKERQEKEIEVGFDENELFGKMREIAKDFKSKRLKHFVTIGVSNNSQHQKEYFEEFLKLIPENTLTVSFSHKNNIKENLIQLNAECGLALFYKLITILIEETSLENIDPIVLFTRCEAHSVANLFKMRSIGIKKIMFDGCSTILINPALVEFIKELLEIRSYTTPERDIKELFEN